MDYAFHALIALIGYFLGALPFGYLVAKRHGVDIFQVGSGNPGATNVRRVLGSRAGNLVFALDALKGALAAALPILMALASSHLLRPPDGMPADEVGVFQAEALDAARLDAIIALVGALLGHSFSVFTRFKGGKGVATAAGGLIVLMPVACAIGAAVWVVTFYATRYVSLASILAAAAVPTASWLLHPSLALKLVATVVGVFVIFRHRQNIRRLLNGTENRFGRKPDAGAGG